MTKNAEELRAIGCALDALNTWLDNETEFLSTCCDWLETADFDSLCWGTARDAREWFVALPQSMLESAINDGVDIYVERREALDFLTARAVALRKESGGVAD